MLKVSYLLPEAHFDYKVKGHPGGEILVQRTPDLDENTP